MAVDSDVVWVPTLPSLSDFAKELDKGTKGAGTKVGERVGKEIASGVERSKAAVDKASEVAEKAHNKVADAAGKVRIAEEQLARARDSGDTLKIARAQEQLATAQRRVSEATTAAENADKSLTSKRDKLARATDDSAQAARENADALEMGEGSMASFGGGIDGLVGKLGGLAAGLGGIVASADAMMEGLDQDRLGDKLAAQLGATPEMAAEFGDMAGSLYAQAYGDSFEDVNDALRGVWQQGLVDEDATNAQIESITAKVLDLTTAFDQDLAGATGAIGTMLKTGLAPDADAAMDILTRGFQQGADKAGDLLDTMTEYPALFQALGIDGQTATGLIAQGMAGGARSADLVADALKEFQIRAIDGSKASAEAYGTIGLNAEEMTAKIAAGGEGAREGLDQVLDGLRAMEDPVERNAAAVGLFGTQAEDLGGALFDLDPSTAVQALGDVGGAAEEMGNTLNDNAATRLEEFKRSAQQFAIDSAGGFIGWVSENIDLLKNLGIVLGVTAIALGGVAIASGILTAGSLLTWVRNLTIAQWLLNSAMLANPWTWVVLAIAGLVAAFVILWNKSEAFRGFWIGLWDSIKNAAAWAWQNVIKPVWDAMKAAFSALGAFFGWVWTSLIKPAWDALGAGIAWVWNAIIRPAWDALKAALGAVGAFFGWVWTSVIKPTWDALGAGIAWVWENVIRPNWDALKWALGAVGDFFSWVWNSVIKPTWDALGAGIAWVADNVVHPVFDGLKTGLGFVETAFQKAVDFIGQMWDRIKGITAKPVKFVIEDVYNNGIREVWNKVAGWLGLEELGKMPMPETLGAYAAGGVLPGYTPGHDVYQFVEPSTGMTIDLSGGESIMVPEWTRAIGGPAEVARQNRAARSGNLGGFADGGTLPGWEKLTSPIQFAMARAVGAAFPNQVITSGTRYEDVGSGYDNHMAQRAVDFGPSGALAAWIAREYPNTIELFWDPGPNLKNGAPTGAIGGHSDHVHWAMAEIADPYTGEVISHDGPGGNGAGGGGLSMVRAMVSRAFSTIIDPILEAMPDFGGGLWGEMPGALIGKLVDGAKEHLGSLAGVFGGGSSLDLSGIAGDNLTIGQAAAEMVGWTGGEWAALKELWTRESGWNNNAQNPTSTAYGIAQFLDSTWAPYGPKTSDPAKQIEYGIRYIQQRYGTPSAAVAFHDANNWYDQGGVLAEGITVAHNESGKPEAILTNQQWRDVSALVHELQFLTPEMKRWVDEGLAELERFANAAEKGFTAWAAATTEQGRMGSPEEFAQHFGTALGLDVADSALGMVGLGGILGGQLNDSTRNLLHAIIDGPIGGEAALLDDDGRVIGTKLDDPAAAVPDDLSGLDMSAPVVPSVDGEADISAEQLPAGTSVTVALPAGKTAYTDEEVKQMLDELDQRVDDLEIRVTDSDNAPAPLGAGVSGIV
ncbi:phage tail tape measure protein [Dietzia cercidiphylli]|uniref:aggregation-promoting factor C-terminal-like domain-containing protein n=3 Tax=Dietzia cercidiphylli TaxID=498199 RepID=UPI0015FBE4AD|nr:transglycosylase SLT domain-containing protein [Dietzia cercidiphylli]